MRKMHFAFIVLVSVFFAACGLMNAPSSFTVKTNEGEDPQFDIKKTYVDMRTDLSEVHFVIANYDLRLKPKGVDSLEPVKSPEQMRITFGLKGIMGEDIRNPIQPGEYSGNKLKWVDIYHFKRGKQLITNIEKINGGVNITSITENAIAGTIDITGEGGKVIKGNFIAEKIY